MSALFTLPFWVNMFSPVPYFHLFWVQFLCALPALVIGFLYFGKSAVLSIRDKAPNMDVLVSLGSLSAVVYSFALALSAGHHHHFYFETAATIISLVLLGNLIEARALSKTSIQMLSTASLLPIKTTRIFYDLETQSQVSEEVFAKDLRLGDTLLLQEGSKVPADAIVLEGEAEINQASITGESAPVFKKQLDEVFAGSIVESGNLKVKVSKTGSQTLAGQMFSWIKSAQASKPEIQKVGDKVSGIFVQVVVSLAVLTFFVNLFFGISVNDALLRAIAVLVVSCPCAMGLATPTAVSVGLGMAAKKGILVKGGGALEKFANIKMLALDKTGTITSGDFLVDTFWEAEANKDYKGLIWHLENHSTHPIAQSIVKNHREWNTKPLVLENIKEVKGYGLQCSFMGSEFKLGAARFAPNNTPNLPDADIYLWENNELKAYFSIKDQPVEGLKESLDYFFHQGISLFLVSGDNQSKVENAAKGLPFAEQHANVLPNQKMELLQKWQKQGSVAMTGDGINDAPALAAANVAIGLGHGSDLAKQQADFILLGKNLDMLPIAHKISKITLGGIKQNLFWALAYNVVAIPVAALGFLNPMWAAMFMAMSDVVVIGNSLRLRFKHI